MQQIYLAIPTMGWVHTELAIWIRDNELFPSYANRIQPVSKARNVIIEAFLKSDKQYLMMVDADTIPPANTISDLISLLEGDGSADVATGITPRIHGKQFTSNVYINYADVENPSPIHELPRSPFRVVGCGASCLLIKREILEKLSKPYCKTIEFDNGAYCSEDLYLCEQVIKAGGTIVAHPGVVCGHVKEIVI